MTPEDDEPNKFWFPPEFADSLAEFLDPLDGYPGQLPFFCDRPDCDGEPHDGLPWDRGQAFRPNFGYNHARAPQQRQCVDRDVLWFILLFMGGRGSGKTRTGAEWLADSMIAPGAENTFWGIVAPTFDDARDICVCGESGLLSVLDRRKIRYNWNKNLGIIDLPDNSARCELYADSNPERLRGPNLSGAWVDEPGSMVNAIGTSTSPGTWQNLKMMCRVGTPKLFVSGTPKPTKFITELRDEASLVVLGSSHDNRKNLADVWFESVVKPLEGTTLSRQEIYGEIMEAIDGALWKRDWIVIAEGELPRMRTVRLGWDPATTSHAKSDEHGIVVAGLALDGSTWILDDGSAILSPESAATRVLQLCVRWGVSLVAVEGNQGGDTWETLLRQAAKALGIQAHQVPKVDKVTSTRSKEIRAQPVAFLYESKSYRVTHARAFDKLEIEMCTWVPKESPDSPNRVDAMVMAVDALGHVTGTRSAGVSRSSAATGRTSTRRKSRHASMVSASSNRSRSGRFSRRIH